MKAKVLVTGANGQLGKTLKDLYLVNNNTIEFVFVTKADLDISKKGEIETYFSSHTFDYCINCAAYTNVEQAEESTEEAFKINSEAVRYLAEFCMASNIILIHISTDYVFDGKKSLSYKETDETNPINVYGRSKLAGEKEITKILNNYFIIRTSWLYSKFPKNFLTSIISKIQQNSDLSITTEQRGTPTSCIELSKFIYSLITTKSDDYGIYHFSAKGEATWYDFVIKIAEHFPDYDKSKISAIGSYQSKAERPKYSVMDNSKAQRKYLGQNFWFQDLDGLVQNMK